jgi:TonB family protein
MKKKRVFLLLILFLIVGKSFSQIIEEKRQKYIENCQTMAKASQIVEQLPEFRGGYGALYDFIINNIKYPAKALKRKKEGQVIIEYVVDRIDGHIRDAKIVKGLTDELDAEALRVVKSMPNWIPGKQNGRDVNVIMNIPINFSLDR